MDKPDTIDSIANEITAIACIGCLGIFAKNDGVVGELQRDIDGKEHESWHGVTCLPEELATRADALVKRERAKRIQRGNDEPPLAEPPTLCVLRSDYDALAASLRRMTEERDALKAKAETWQEECRAQAGATLREMNSRDALLSKIAEERAMAVRRRDENSAAMVDLPWFTATPPPLTDRAWMQAEIKTLKEQLVWRAKVNENEVKRSTKIETERDHYFAAFEAVRKALGLRHDDTPKVATIAAEIVAERDALVARMARMIEGINSRDRHADELATSLRRVTEERDTAVEQRNQYFAVAEKLAAKVREFECAPHTPTATPPRPMPSEREEGRGGAGSGGTGESSTASSLSPSTAATPHGGPATASATESISTASAAPADASGASEAKLVRLALLAYEGAGADGRGLADRIAEVASAVASAVREDLDRVYQHVKAQRDEAMKVELECARVERDYQTQCCRDAAAKWREAERVANLAMTEGLAECERLRAALFEQGRDLADAWRSARKRANKLARKSNALRAKAIASGDACARRVRPPAVVCVVNASKPPVFVRAGRSVGLRPRRAARAG